MNTYEGLFENYFWKFLYAEPNCKTELQIIVWNDYSSVELLIELHLPVILSAVNNILQLMVPNFLGWIVQT